MVAPVNEEVAAALAAVPWLADLDALLQRGTWAKHIKTTEGEPSTIEGLVYSRCWPDWSSDALLIRSETDASALRLNPDGYQVWARTGGARELINALRLARGQAALTWLPTRELRR